MPAKKKVGRPKKKVKKKKIGITAHEKRKNVERRRLILTDIQLNALPEYHTALKIITELEELLREQKLMSPTTIAKYKKKLTNAKQKYRRIINKHQ